MPRSEKPLSVLAVSPSPDERRETAVLRELVERLDSRSDVRATTWFLFHGSSAPLPGERIIDELRTDWLLHRMGRLGTSRVAGWLRGFRLRLWWRVIDPDVVVLDDGLGERVLTPHRRVVTVVRYGDTSAQLDAEEASLSGRPDVVIVPSGDDPRSDDADVVIELKTRRDRDAERSMSEPSNRETARKKWGIRTGVPVVIGRSEDNWHESGDLFVRTVWALHRAGVEYYGCWLLETDDREEQARIAAEAARCGISEFIQVVAEAPPGLEQCGDVLYLPYRHAANGESVRSALCSGMEVVAFDAATPEDRQVNLVADLDTVAAAEAIASCDLDSRVDRSRRLCGEHDLQTWIDEFLETVERLT